MIKYKRGDLLANVKDPNVFIAHGCNCRGQMGSGFALQVKLMYPKAYERYLDAYEKERLFLGNIMFVRQDKDSPCIVNMQTQDGYGRKGIFVDYDAVRSCFKEFSIMNINKQDLHIPKIGAGLAGGNWEVISGIIEEECKGFDVYVWELDLQI